jgi:signal transduction histidine kinase
VETGADGRTAVTVTDDGVGIDPELVANATGLGEKGSIVGRMKRVGGHASLQDAPGGGNVVQLVLPPRVPTASGPSPEQAESADSAAR